MGRSKMSNVLLLVHLMVNLFLTCTESSKVFYKLNDKYLSGHVIRVMYVDEPTECVGMCMHMGKCQAFNVELNKKGGTHMCEFLRDNRCGFVEDKKNALMFTSHRQCSFNIRQKSNWKCITRTENGFLREATRGEKCQPFQLNLDGTGFKMDGMCVGVKKEQGPVEEVDWLVSSDFAEDEKCAVHLSGTDDQSQITEISSKKCLSNFRYDVHTYLVLDECGSKNYFKIQWEEYPSADTTEEMARQHITYPVVPYVLNFAEPEKKRKEGEESIKQDVD